MQYLLNSVCIIIDNLSSFDLFYSKSIFLNADFLTNKITENINVGTVFIIQ